MLDSATGQMRVKAAFAAIHAIEGHHHTFCQNTPSIGIPNLACGLGYSTLHRKIPHVHLVPLNVGSKHQTKRRTGEQRPHSSARYTACGTRARLAKARRSSLSMPQPAPAADTSTAKPLTACPSLSRLKSRTAERSSSRPTISAEAISDLDASAPRPSALGFRL